MRQVESWSKKTKCPFCASTIVEAFDFTKIPDELSEEEQEKFTSGDAGIDQIDGRCEHLALLSKYPDGWTEVLPLQLTNLTKFANSVKDDDLLEKPIAVDDVESELDMLIREDVDTLLDYGQKKLGDLQVAIETIYVEKGDGPIGGGPRYCAIFIQ